MHNDLFRPEVVENFSPEGRAAVDHLKDFILSTVSIDVLEEQALKFAGLPQAEMDEALAVVCRELAELFTQDKLSDSLRIGLSLAVGEIIRDRIAELQARGVGHT